MGGHPHYDAAPFIRVMPAEVARYGPAAAIVLAHIRYRCESDRPGRIADDGTHWWRVSLRDLGRDVGLSVKAVRTALQALGGAVTANHFPPLEDQTLAYRVAADNTAEAAPKNRADLPDAATGTVLNNPDLPDAATGKGPCPYGQGTVPLRASALPITELTEERTEPPYPPSRERPPTRPATDGRSKALARLTLINTTARSVTAYRIAEAFSASLPTPIETGLLTDIGAQIDKCLRAAIPPSAIAAGLKAWTQSDSWSPTQIPRFVHKANNRDGKPTNKALGWQAAGAELLAEMEQQQ